jgi:glutamyl-tRNA synthetase
VLRIEDTDQNRYIPGAQEYIMEALKWCGIEVDEGIEQGGPFAPYRQSDRKAIYKEFAEKLISLGKAYYAFDTPEELEALRSRLELEKASNLSYSLHSRMQMKNSLSLSDEETKNRITSGEPYVIRFLMPENRELNFKDIIRGEIKVNTNTLDDKVLYKSDGMPTYHLANIVDDHLMEISHVIRGEEWLPSLPLHVLLYEALEWEAPEFAHMPLTLKPSGKGKLSKRDGDKLGFPVFPLEWKNPLNNETSSGYRESGYFPDAFINILAFLGWNPGTEQEIFSMDELIEAFSLERVGKAGSRFDPEKAKWFNHQYLISKSDEELAALYQNFLNSKKISAPIETLSKIVGLIKERADFVSDFWEQSAFFFVAPDTYDPKTVKKRWNGNAYSHMMELKTLLQNIDDFSSARLEEKVKSWITEKEYSMGAIMNVFRLLIVGEPKGPHLFDIISILEKDETLKRIEYGCSLLGDQPQV